MGALIGSFGERNRNEADPLDPDLGAYGPISPRSCREPRIGWRCGAQSLSTDLTRAAALTFGSIGD